MADFSRCLRPEFTKQVFEELLQGHSLNLFGPKGSGRSRLLEDLEQLALGDGIHVIRANLKGFQFNYRGFLKYMERQMTQPEPGVKLLMQENVNAPLENLPGITTLFEHHGRKSSRRIFILLDDFDAIVGNPQHEFPQEFFNDLNSLKRTTQCSLCCVTKESHSGKKIYYEGGRKHSSSWLELTPLDIPHFKRGEIAGALNAHLQENPHWMKELNKERVITAIHSKFGDKAWYMLQLIVEDYAYQNEGKISYKRRLKHCRRKLKKRYPYRREWWESFSWEGIKREIKELFGIFKEGKTLLKTNNKGGA